jgi:hypothetical protein
MRLGARHAVECATNHMINEARSEARSAKHEAVG